MEKQCVRFLYDGLVLAAFMNSVSGSPMYREGIEIQSKCPGCGNHADGGHRASQYGIDGVGKMGKRADPCYPTPCGPNSQCRKVNNGPVCACLPGYIGSPPTCRPECVVSVECSKNRACMKEKCVDPCVGACGVRASCEVLNHIPFCECPAGTGGDPFVRCTPNAPVRPSVSNRCHPTLCGPNSQCYEVNNKAVCICLPGYIGLPPSCVADCAKNEDCMKRKFISSCHGLCGDGARCEVVDHNPTCKCPKGYNGDPSLRCYPPTAAGPPELDPYLPFSSGQSSAYYKLTEQSSTKVSSFPVKLRHECLKNQDCSPHLACIDQMCKDPCFGSCGANAVCEVINHYPICACAVGYSGDPFVTCNLLHNTTLNKRLTPCIPSPCGSNTICRENNGAVSCTCMANHFGNPLRGCHRLQSDDKISTVRSSKQRSEQVGEVMTKGVINNTCIILREKYSKSGNSKESVDKGSENVPSERVAYSDKNKSENGSSIVVDNSTGSGVTNISNGSRKTHSNIHSSGNGIGSKSSMKFRNETTRSKELEKVGSSLKNATGETYGKYESLQKLITMSPDSRCKCLNNEDCSSKLACIDQICKDPCHGSCGVNALCKVINHHPICACAVGYYGDPFVTCDLHNTILIKRLTLCTPSPCGSNTICRENNGAVSCTCMPNHVGNPLRGCHRLQSDEISTVRYGAHGSNRLSESKKYMNSEVINRTDSEVRAEDSAPGNVTNADSVDKRSEKVQNKMVAYSARSGSQNGSSIGVDNSKGTIVKGPTVFNNASKISKSSKSDDNYIVEVPSIKIDKLDNQQENYSHGENVKVISKVSGINKKMYENYGLDGVFENISIERVDKDKNGTDVEMNIDAREIFENSTGHGEVEKSVNREMTPGSGAEFRYVKSINNKVTGGPVKYINTNGSESDAEVGKIKSDLIERDKRKNVEYMNATIRSVYSEGSRIARDILSIDEDASSESESDTSEESASSESESDIGEESGSSESNSDIIEKVEKSEHDSSGNASERLDNSSKYVRLKDGGGSEILSDATKVGKDIVSTNIKPEEAKAHIDAFGTGNDSKVQDGGYVKSGLVTGDYASSKSITNKTGRVQEESVSESERSKGTKKGDDAGSGSRNSSHSPEVANAKRSGNNKGVDLKI